MISKNFKLVAAFLFLAALVLVVLTTNFYGNTDIYDYSNVAKFFSGDLNAKIRTSHSYLYGFIHSPFVDIMDSFLIFKITSLIFLGLIIYSTYIISARNKKALLLSIFSPIVWFMAPWISPIQLASLLFLWGYYFIKKYNESHLKTHLFYSGVLIGLSWAFWDGVLFFIPLFAISFLHDKKASNFLLFFVFTAIGVLPRLILDQILFGFALQGVMRHILATTAIFLYGGVYGETVSSGAMSVVIIFLIPWFSYIFFKKEIFNRNKKDFIFLILSIFLLFANSQIRLLLLFFPLIIILLAKNMNEKQFNIQIVIFIIIAAAVAIPYILQANKNIGSIEGQDIGSLIVFKDDINLEKSFSGKVLTQDLKNIGEDHPKESFIVGGTYDAYASFAGIYWGEDIKEFVSMQDYNLFLSGDPTISEKTICTNNDIKDRRDFCLSVLIRNSFNDATDYNNIKYAISDENVINLKGFELVKKYESLYLFEKTN